MRITVLIISIFSLAAFAPNSMAQDAPAKRSLSVTPRIISQGDPFVVRVMDTGLDSAPKAALSGKRLYFAGCGRGCYEAIGVAPLSMDPGDYNIMLDAGRGVEALALRVSKGKFASQSLTIDKDKVDLSPEDEARADAEEAMLKSLWRQETRTIYREGGFIMPLEGEFSTEYGVRRTINRTRLSVHSGVDIRGAYGTPVKAANGGVVAVARELFFGGNTIVLDHGQGVYTIYMHLQEFRVSPSEVVSKGDVIGLVGSTGRSTGPHLHYTVKVNGDNANPSAMAALPLMGTVEAAGEGL